MAERQRPQRREGERRLVAQNRKAFHEYFIEDRIEAGLLLTGTEVKSLREGRATISEAYAGESGGELVLFNAHIPEFHGGNRFNHEPRRPRKLLVRRRELDKLAGAVRREGVTLVPLQLYFTPRGWAKVELGLARGKKAHDKRESIKERDWQREKQRLMRHAGR
jgi:SsrA-binding protein